MESVEVRAVPGGWAALGTDRYAVADSRDQALDLLMKGQTRHLAQPGYQPLFQQGSDSLPADAEAG